MKSVSALASFHLAGLMLLPIVSNPTWAQNDSESLTVADVTGNEPIVGGPSEGCEAVFQGLPASLGSRARIAPPEQPGEPMQISGRVLRDDGSPAPGTIVYAYHTDKDGIYPPPESPAGEAARRHGKLRGWAVADENGYYRFDSIRPASYPGTEIPQHVHMHILEPGRCTYYIESIEFTDDPLLTEQVRDQHSGQRGGSGVVTPRKSSAGIWLVERDIILGKEIPDYPDP